MTKDTKNPETNTFSEDERGAMKERILELRANKKDGEAAVLEKIQAMPEPDRSLAKRIHEIVKENALELKPKTWYGMPAYANAEGKVVCFFQAASKFKYRFSTLGFQEDAHLDEGNLWPISYAITKLTENEEREIAELVKKAVS